MRWLPNTRGGKIRAGILITIFLVLALRPVAVRGFYVPQEGDVVFQSLPGGSDLMVTIEGATHSPFSRCGAVVKKDGRWMVIEAIGEVHFTPLFEWIVVAGAITWPLTGLNRSSRRKIPAMITGMEKRLGRPYDYRYELGDDRVYCSSLVYKGWQVATGKPPGHLVRLGDLDWKPYRVVIQKYDECGPDDLPLDRLMITPRDLAQAPELEQVFDCGY